MFYRAILKKLQVATKLRKDFMKEFFHVNFVKFFKIWGSYGQKTIQKQPPMVVFAATKTFENS